MPTVRVKVKVPESRQVTITLPDDFPLGDVELEIILRRPLPDLPQFDETPAQQEAFWASILAFRDEVNRATKSGPYAEDDGDESPDHVE